MSSFKRLDTHLWRGMLAYSLPLVPDAILVYIIGFSDQVFLASMQDTAVSAHPLRSPTVYRH